MNKWLIIFVSLLFLFTGVATAWKIQNPSKVELKTSFLFPTSQPLGSILLKDQYGKKFDNQRLKGQWNLVFIGFTSCPDICPTTMTKLSAAYKGLNQYAPLQVIFLSVDPARDTQEKLKNYMSFFNSEFVAITAPHKELYPLTRQLGMIYAMVGEGEDYTVDHSASMVLINPQGEKVAVIKPRTDGKQIPQIRLNELVADVQTIQRL